MSHLLPSIAWTLIHFCWQAAAVAALYGAASLALARRSSHTRYAVALAALLLMLLSAVVTFGWELRATAAASVSLTGAQPMAGAAAQPFAPVAAAQPAAQSALQSSTQASSQAGSAQDPAYPSLPALL